MTGITEEGEEAPGPQTPAPDHRTRKFSENQPGPMEDEVECCEFSYRNGVTISIWEKPTLRTLQSIRKIAEMNRRKVDPTNCIMVKCA